MKHLLSALLMLALVACQKENRNQEEQPVVEPQPIPATVCKVATIQEYPAVDGNSAMRTFTYDGANRVTKMEVQNGTAAAVTKTISYNSSNKIEKITSNNGSYEMFSYSSGIVTGWEAFDEKGKAVKKAAYTYNDGHLVREDRYNYNTTTAAYEQADYLVYDWDANDNIASVKAYTAANVLTATDVYTYHADKLNKQQTITPQLALLFMNWSNDITAFINSKYLLKQVASKGRNLVYETNESGWVTKIKNDRKENLFAFTYGCTN